MLVFGEDQNDTEALRELIIALCPELESRVETRRWPLVLLKDARPEEIPERAQQIAGVVAAERSQRDMPCIFVHEDCDAVEPAHEVVARRIEQALANVGCPAHAVIPAWEIEAWWFLWPSAVTAAQPSWNIPKKYLGTQVGFIVNAKEEFRRAVRASRRPRVRQYRESDSPLIAEKVRAMGLARNPQAKSLSYERFTKSVDSCCDWLASTRQ